MAYENLCMYCFQDLGGHSTCPHCGRDSHAAVPQIQMLPGTLVYHGRFLVGRALGQDATGIVYAAFDTKRENKLRIREYLPRDCAERLNDGMIVPIAGMEDKFDNGIRRLRASVEETDDPRRRHFFFEENGTAYIVQRKTAAQESARNEDDGDDGEESGVGRKRAIVIALIAAVVVIGAAVALITMFNGALNGAKDITETPTLDPDQVWVPSESPTATPYATPTFAALVDPDLSWMDFTLEDSGTTSTQDGGETAPKVTAAPTLSGDASSYKNVSTKSSTSEVRKVQQRLAELGWLSASKISGKYDKTTKNAVLAFQKHINKNYNPAEKLAEDGIAGPKTQQWLYQIDAVKPTATPKPAVTADPDEAAVDENSSAKRIRAMQRELILLGVLPEGADTGNYDAATRSAVKRFQARVNQLQGYDVLEVTGVMDALSMAFLDYYVDEWREIQTATAEPTAKATAKVTAAPTQYDSESDPNPVDAQSAPEAIRSVQRRLIAIGLLPAGADDGVYGESTTRAVRTFQQWVNQQRNEQTLPMNGIADALTRAYLKYCQEHDMRPAAEVTRVPDDSATVVPGGEDEEEIGEPEDFTIDGDSDKASIQRVQQMLADVGLLSRSGIDGVYGPGTAVAVQAFQQYVNAHGGSLPVTGIVDSATRKMLEYYSDHGLMAVDTGEVAAQPTEVPAAAPTDAPTAVPTEVPTAIPTEVPTAIPTEIPTAIPTEIPTAIPTDAPTPEPPPEPAVEDEEIGEDGDVSVDGDSEAESIRYIQKMLIRVGALSSDHATGVYDSATAKAVVNFQKWINRESIMNLEVTGTVDNGTRQMLEYCADHDLRMGIDDIQVTADEDGEDPEDPDNPFDEPDGEGDDWDDEDEEENMDEVEGDRAFASSVDSLNVTVDGRDTGVGAVEVGDGSFTVDWEVEGVASGYSVYVSDSAGNPIISEERTKNTSFRVDAARMEPGEVYTVTIGAVPEGGGEEDIVWRTAKFVRPVQATPEPTAEPTPEPLPTVGSVSAPAIEIAGQSAEGGLVTVEEGGFWINWSAEGGVQGYNVQITDAEGNLIANQVRVPQTSVEVREGQMQPGMVYTIAVGAVPVNGGENDVVWSRGQFMLPAPITPEPTPESTEVPTPEPTPTPTPEPTPASISAPSVTVGGSGYQQDGVQYMTDNTIIISWGAEGDVDSYIIYVENQSGERQNLGTSADTSRTVQASSLPAGIYTVYVGAIPMYGGEEDAQWATARFGIPAPTPEPTEEPTPEPVVVETPEPLVFTEPVTAETDPQILQELQLRLYTLGVMAGEPEPGALDNVTLQAVAEFQNRVNEQYAAGLVVVNPNDPQAMIDLETLGWISRGL